MTKGKAKEENHIHRLALDYVDWGINEDDTGPYDDWFMYSCRIPGCDVRFEVDDRWKAPRDIGARCFLDQKPHPRIPKQISL